MKLHLLDPNVPLCTAWRESFADIVDVAISQSTFEPLIGTFDCLVSPANSFGLMDGGMDAAITEFFGAELERRVQEAIWKFYRGEQPVGTCLMVPTHHPQCPWLAHCPTMRVPVDVSRTNNAYAAFLAALVTAEAHGVKTLGCAGLATLTGRMPPEVAARQMRFAYDMWIGTFTPPNWTKPLEREWRSHGRSQAEFLQQHLRRSS